MLTRLLLPLSWPKGKKVWLSPPWKSDPKAVLKTVILNWGYQYRELTFVKTHLSLSEAFWLKDVCCSLTFPHIFSIPPHHQGGCRQLGTRRRREGESRAWGRGHSGKAPWGPGVQLQTLKKGKPCWDSGEAASAVCPLPEGEGTAATTRVAGLQRAPEEPSRGARLAVQCATSLIRGCWGMQTYRV